MTEPEPPATPLPEPNTGAAGGAATEPSRALADPAPGTAPDPVAAEPEPEPTGPTAAGLREYELPGARRIVTSGLSLAYRTTSELRRASLYIGLLTLAILGPPIVVVIELVAKLRLTDLSAIASLGDDPSAALLFSGVLLLVYVALACWITVAVDGHLIAIALLAAKASGRPYSIRDATVRARQVFWRQVRGAIVAGVFVIVVELIVLAALTQVARDNSANGFVAGVIATLIAAPLGYLSTGIVLGDVGAIEALKRSIRLARARPRTAIVVALFAVITSAIQTFALGAGLELLVDAGNALHVDLASSVVPLTITILVVLAFVMAFGSLTFTISAIVAAPQVAAFLGLTFYSAGLDRALVTSPSDRKFRWVTRPMIALIVVTAMISGFALTSVGAVQPLAREPLLELLFNQAPGHAAVLGQPHRHQSDPAGDESGPPDPSVDITDAEYAYLPVVPDFLLDGLFKCGGTHVACDPDTSLRQTFASGAMLVLVQLSAPYPAVASGRVSSWAMVFDRPDLLPVSGNEEFPGNFIVVTEIRNGALRIYSRAVTQGLGSTQSTPTPARSAWVGSALATIIPISTITMPSEWNVVADVGPPGAPATSDRIASNAFDGLLPFDEPPWLFFPGSPFPIPSN